jgi:isopenicillin-N epimerase
MIEGVDVGWENIRECFSLDRAVAHLNHGSFGAVPIAVQRAQQRLRDEMDANPMRFFTVGLDERIAHVRRHLAAFLGADAEGSALVENATAGIAIALNSVEFKPGDEIVTTNHGYGAVRLAVGEVCRRTGAVSRTAELPLTPEDDAVLAAIRNACSDRTKLVIIDAITSTTARRLPTTGVVAVAREVGSAVLVDAAHAPGLLTTPVAEIGADFWVGNLHKWVFSPRGTALLCVAPAWRDRVSPVVVSEQHGLGFPESLEWLGARDYTPWLAAPSGLFTLRTLGLDVVRAHNANLAAYGQRMVGEALGVDDDLPDNPGLPLRLVPLPPGAAADHPAATALRRRIADELATEVKVSSWHGRGLLRLSAQVYNRPAEYERLAAGLPDLLGARS